MIDIIKCIQDVEYLEKVVVEGHGEYLLTLANIPQRLQLIAVNNNPENIRYIQQPSEKTKKVAVLLKPEVIKYIKEPNEDIQTIAIKHNVNLLCYIPNPAPNVLSIAMQTKPSLICQFATINRDILKSLLKRDGTIVRDIDPSTMDDELWEIAIKSQPFSIQYKENPSHELCELAINSNPFVIKWIKNPSAELIKSALIKNVDIVGYLSFDHLNSSEQVSILNQFRVRQVLEKIQPMPLYTWLEHGINHDGIVNIIKTNPLFITKIKDCPDSLITYAVSVCPDIIKYLDIDYCDEIQCIAANLDYTTLNVMGPRSINVEIAAIECNPNAIEFAEDGSLIDLATNISIIRHVDMYNKVNTDNFITSDSRFLVKVVDN